MKLITALTIVSLITIVSCGKEEEGGGTLNASSGAPMATELNGAWLVATLAEGATNPTATPCTAKDGNSRSEVLTIADDKLTTKLTHFVGSTTCTGIDKITITEKITFVPAQEADQFEIVTFAKTMTVATATAAAALNTDRACGKADWEINAYGADDEHLTGCTAKDDRAGTAKNTGRFMTHHVGESAMQAIVIRVKKQGTGLSYSMKYAELSDAYFSDPSHFAPSP